MHLSPRSRLNIPLSFSLVTAVVLICGYVVAGGWTAPRLVYAAKATSTHAHIDCGNQVQAPLCTDVVNSDDHFGVYVGHDEPSTLFYSNAPGSGNRNSWKLTLPRDPSASNPLAPGKSYNFELHPAFWFGMAMCDTQSDPNQLTTCTPDSDKNIVDPTVSPKHPGTAFMEMQFYPPGWVPNALGPAGSSCDPTRWCAALNIDSLSDNPVTGQNNNPACAAAAGLEYVNFAYITKNGVPQGPISPLLATNDTFRANTQKDLMMNSGDTVIVTMHDTAHGLRIDLNDRTTRQSGFMVASAANGFAQVKFDPTGNNCDPATHNLPYDFHPMYSTSSEMTSVPWAIHTYNVAFSDEIGHFDFCTGPNAITPTGVCPKGNTEGQGSNAEPADPPTKANPAGDDFFCFPTSSSLRIQVPGCVGENDGFDGQSYEPRWPDGNTQLHPTSILFSSPLTGQGYSTNYSRTAFEADLPALESFISGTCDVLNGIGCSLIPSTDDCLGAKGAPPCIPADFYPFFSIRNVGGHCLWQLGNHIPGSKNDFGQNAEYGRLLQSSFTAFGGGGASAAGFFNFRQIFSKNPCKA
jgi:hypothetical protein